MARSRAVALVAVLAAAQGGCEAIKETKYDMHVRDPTRVSVEYHGQTIVPEGEAFPRRPLIEARGEKYTIQRDLHGAISVDMPSSLPFFPPVSTMLVSSSGDVTPDILDGKLQLESTVRAPVCQMYGRHGCVTELDLLTPRDNLTHLAKIVAPSRFTGAMLAGTSALFGSVGGFFLWNALSEPAIPGNDGFAAVGALAVTMAAAGLGWAAWYLFAPSRTEVLVGEAVK